MRVQITNYGVQQMVATGEPLEITKYVLGSEAGYTPKMDATGILGDEVYSGSPTEIEIVNANVYKYQIGLDYNVGNFNFGEIALYDSTDTCVAVGVSESTISKLKTSSNSGGNSVVLGVYMSMAAKNYAMWIDTLASDNQYSVPILETVDNLSTTADAYPNFYIVKGASPTQSSILAYTSKDGLWYFDAYSYKNQATLTISNCTSTTVQFKTTGISSDELSDITALSYYGDKIVEFTSGKIYSICRYAKSISIVGSTATISFSTPLAELPVVGDTFVIFGRNELSTSNVVLPPATEETIGAVKAGRGLEVQADGTMNYVPIPASVEQIGDVKPGDYLSIREDGTLDVDLSRNRLFANLAPFNESESLLKLSKTGDEEIAGKDGAEFSGARVPVRQLTYGSLYFAGNWDASANRISNDVNQHLADNGILITTIDASEDSDLEEPVSTTKEYAPMGYIYRVSVAGNTVIDGISDWNVGDLVLCTGKSWVLLGGSQSLLEKPKEGSGFIFLNEDRKTTKAVNFEDGTSGVVVTTTDDKLTFELSETGVAEGTHAAFITVDKYGRVHEISDRLAAGTF